jgi:hypothetical protein
VAGGGVIPLLAFLTLSFGFLGSLQKMIRKRKQASVDKGAKRRAHADNHIICS